jgi:thiol-disulfide isomerase/thioredoxin
MSQNQQPGSVRVQERPRRPAGQQRHAGQQRPGAQRSRSRPNARRQRRSGLLLSIGTVIVVAVIVVVALIVNNSNNSGGSGLTDPNALNPPQKLLAVGSKAPDFNLATVDGKHYTLSSQRGHPVLLEFFAVWCPHCQRMAPVINQLDKTYASQGLQTLQILANPYGRNYDSSGGSDTRLANAGDIRWFQQNFSVTHPILIDPKFVTVNKYGAYSYPTIYVVDRNGVIVSGTYGEVPQAQVAAAIQKAAKA